MWETCRASFARSTTYRSPSTAAARSVFPKHHPSSRRMLMRSVSALTHLLQAPLTNARSSSVDSRTGCFFRRLLHPADQLPGFRPSAVEPDQQALAGDSAAAGAVKWREPDLCHHRGQEDPSVRLGADRARRPIIRQDIETHPHNRTIKQIDGLNPSRPDLELVEEPQAQQRQDAKQVKRAFCHKSHDGPSIDNTAVSSIAPSPVNPSEMPNSCGVVIGKGG